MNLNDYQAKAITTALPNAFKFSYLVPGLAGETGELVEAYEEWLNGNDEDKKTLYSEMADHLWFVALIAHQFGVDLERFVFVEDKWDEEIFDSLTDYQETAAYANDSENVTTQDLINSLVIYGGEAVSAHAKAVRDDDGVLTAKRERALVLAVNNILFTVTRIAVQHGVTLEELMEQNINKLLDRKDRGVLGGSGNNR